MYLKKKTYGEHAVYLRDLYSIFIFYLVQNITCTYNILFNRPH